MQTGKQRGKTKKTIKTDHNKYIAKAYFAEHALFIHVVFWQGGLN